MGKRQRIQSTAVAASPDGIDSRQALVFISHDSRDSEIAEAFSNLLRGATAGMLKSFWSSDKSGKEGLEYGSEWYSGIMKQIDGASDVVCLLTPRSFERPWILYEAGVAKGKLGTPVHGLVLGMQMSQVAGSGPFGQFQNCSGDSKTIAGLVLQLARRIPGCTPDEEIVTSQATIFLETANGLLASSQSENAQKKKPEEEFAAKLYEEIKVMFKELPENVVAMVAERIEPRLRRESERSNRSPLRHLRLMSREMLDGDAGWHMALGFLREDFPWLYELGVRVSRAAEVGNDGETRKALDDFMNGLSMARHSPMIERKSDYEMMHFLTEVFMHQTNRLMDRPKATRKRTDDSKQ